MEALIRLFGNICRFKQGPENIPASIGLFVVLLGSNFIIEMFLGLSVYSFARSLFLAFLSALTLYGLTFIWLMLFQFRNRFLQTATAFTGVNLFTNIFCFIPVTILWQMGVFIDNIFALINLILLFWILSIYAHIYKKALNVSFFLGFALSVTYFITYSAFSNFLIGAQQ